MKFYANMIVSKVLYVSPVIEVYDVCLECGFASSSNAYDKDDSLVWD